jgi:hypothetical protein
LSALTTEDARTCCAIEREIPKRGIVLHGAHEFSRGDGHHSNAA